MSAGDASGARGLGKRFVRGIAFVSIGAWLGTACTIVTNILLARILGPEIVGFYAYVFAFNAVIGALGALSLGLTLIQSKEAPPRLFDTAFTLSLLVAGALVGVSALVSIYLAMSRSALAALFLIVLGFARIMDFCARVPLASIERQVRYARSAAIDFTSNVVPQLIAVGLALGVGGPWPFLARDVLLCAFVLVLSLVLSGYRPRLRWNADEVRELLAYSRHMYFSRNLEIALQRSDRIVLGGWLGNAALGLYAQSRQFGEMPLAATTQLSRVAFNAFARFRDDPPRLSRATFILNYALLRAVLSFVVLLLAFPNELIRLLLGGDWLEAVPILRAVAGVAALQPVFSLLRALLNGRGWPQYVVRIRAAQLVLFLPLVAAAGAVGSLEGAAFSLLLVAMLGVTAAAYLNRDLLLGHLTALLTAPLVSAAVSVAVAWSPLGQTLRPALPPWLLVFLPVLLYALGLLALDGRRMRRELGYLWAMARGSQPR